MSGFSRKVLPIFFRSIDVGQDTWVLHLHLEPLFKIAANHRSGSFRKILLQELWEEGSAKEHGVSPPSLESGYHQGRSGFAEPSNQCPNRVRPKKRVIHRGEEYRCGVLW
jgi:hypothetical protein